MKNLLYKAPFRTTLQPYKLSDNAVKLISSELFMKEPVIYYVDQRNCGLQLISCNSFLIPWLKYVPLVIGAAWIRINFCLIVPIFQWLWWRRPGWGNLFPAQDEKWSTAEAARGGVVNCSRLPYPLVIMLVSFEFPDSKWPIDAIRPQTRRRSWQHRCGSQTRLWFF